MPATETGSIDLSSVDTVLATARSVRRRLDFEREVPAEVILDCIDIATQAPTGLGGESWRFVVVTEQARKQALSTLYGDVLDELATARGVPIKTTQRALVDRLHEIPAMILVCTVAEGPSEEIAGQVAYYGSILPAAWSLMLAKWPPRVWACASAAVQVMGSVIRYVWPCQTHNHWPVTWA